MGEEEEEERGELCAGAILLDGEGFAIVLSHKYNLALKLLNYT